MESSCYIEQYDGRHGVIRTRRASVYKVNSLVTIYYLESDFPQRIGFGFIENQQDSFQTIVVKKKFEEFKDIWDKIESNDSSTLKNSYIVPTFFEKYIHEYLADE